MNIVPMSTIAKLARWKTPIFMREVYHSCRFNW
jgi:hypothetical protein